MPAFEVKANERVSGTDVKGLSKLREALGDQHVSFSDPWSSPQTVTLAHRRFRAAQKGAQDFRLNATLQGSPRAGGGEPNAHHRRTGKYRSSTPRPHRTTEAVRHHDKAPSAPLATRASGHAWIGY